MEDNYSSNISDGKNDPSSDLENLHSSGGK